MVSIQQTEMSRKYLSNGHVVVSYKLGGTFFHDEYKSLTDAEKKDPTTVIAKSYNQKDENGNLMRVYVNPQKTAQILRIVTYDANNKPAEEVHFDTHQNKTLLRYYHNGNLNQDWILNPNTGQIKTGYQYKKNADGKYDILSVSKPVYAPNGDLSHTVQTATTTDGKPTGQILQRVFYLCNLPFVRASYTYDKKNYSQPTTTIFSLEDGQWEPVTNEALIEHLNAIFKRAINLETPAKEKTSVLAQNSDLDFKELSYEDVQNFKKINPSIQVLSPSQVEEIPSEEEKKEAIKNLTPEEFSFVKQANNAGYFVSFIPQNSTEEFLFVPSKSQYNNANQSRKKEKQNLETLSYLDVLNAKENFWGFGIVSQDESKSIPLLPSLRQNFFETLSEEEQIFVLKANLAGHNVALKGDNGLAFLYMAPKTEIARTRIKTTLTKLTKNSENTLSDNSRTTSIDSKRTPSLQPNKQYT